MTIAANVATQMRHYVVSGLCSLLMTKHNLNEPTENQCAVQLKTAQAVETQFQLSVSNKIQEK